LTGKKTGGNSKKPGGGGEGEVYAGKPKIEDAKLGKENREGQILSAYIIVVAGAEEKSANVDGTPQRKEGRTTPPETSKLEKKTISTISTRSPMAGKQAKAPEK